MASIKTEFRKQLRLAIAAAAGFIIGIAWKDFIFQSTGNLLSKFLTLGPKSSAFAIAIFLTFLGALVIFISSRILKEL